MAFGDVVQTNSGNGTTATVTPTLGSGVTAGSLIVLTFAADDYNGTPNAGWTQSTGMEQQTFCGAYLWWFIATSNGQTIPNYTVASAVRSHWQVVEYAGPFDAAPYDTSQGQFQQTSTTSYTTPAIAPSTGSRLLIAGMFFQQSGSDLGTPGTWLNSFTQRISTVNNGANPRLAVGQATRLVTGDGATTYSTGATLSTGQVAGAKAGLIASFKAGSGGGGATLTATPADPVGVTDSVNISVTYSRTISDTVGITDTGSQQTLDLAQTVSDPVGISDSVTVARVLARTITDAVGIADNATASASAVSSATPADPVSVTDTIAVVQAYARTIADAVGLTDNATVSVTAAGAANQPDPVGVSDQVATAMESPRTVVDPVAIADALTVIVGRVAADGVGVTDSVTVSLTSANGSTTSDTVGVGDQVGVVLQVTRTATDAIGVTDVVSALLAVDPSGFEDITVVVSLAPRRTSASLEERTTTATLAPRRTTATLEDR